MIFALNFLPIVAIVLVLTRMDAQAHMRLMFNLPDGCSVDDVNRAAGDEHTCPRCGNPCVSGLCGSCRREDNEDENEN